MGGSAMRLGVLTYTSTGVRPPWVTEQQTAPAKACIESVPISLALKAQSVRICCIGQLPTAWQALSRKLSGQVHRAWLSQWWWEEL